MFQLTKKTSLKSLPLCILITAFLFTAISCENFLSGGNLKSDVDNIIADVNAEKVSVLLSAEGQGEVNPSGNQVFKIGRENKKISYTEDKEHKYCFLYWAVKAGTGDNAKYLKKGVDYTIDDEYSPETKITILKYTKDMAVVPVCAERIAVEDYSPKMVKDGVSRDRSISINFSKEPSLLSFYFTLDEIPGECDYHEIEIGSEKYIAYYIDELENRVFKNITILDTDKNNLCEYFDPPVIEGKLLTINVSKQIPIDTTGSRTVEVTLGSSIYDNSKEKVTMNKEVNFQYKITEETDVKSYVTLKSPVDESKEDKPEMGTVAKTFDKKDFSIGASFDLSFTENADYQFIKWTYDPQCIYVENPEDISAKAMIRDAADRDTPTEVTALCAPRLAVKSFYPVTDVNTLTVCKDQTIKILFNNPLPLDESQLEKITITIGGLTVKTSFKAPVVEQTERKEITFEADKSKMISFQGERQKTVTVSIPADLYYLYDDTYEVTVGGSGKTFSYDIDDTTLDKAEVYFRIPEGSGTITPAANEMFNYSRGETVALEFKMNDDFIFNGWEIKAGNTDVSASDIEIADKKSLSTKLYVHEAITNVTVTANCSPKFKIEEITPAGTESNPSEKDSSIVIKFNKPLAAACDLLKIKVTQNGKAVDSSFSQRVLSGNTVTLTNTKLLNILSDDGVIPVTVTVPADFYYNDGINDISLGEKYVYDYYVNYKTLKQAKITFGIINGENNQFLTGVGTINQEAFSSFSIGETAQLECNLDQNYQFVKWELKTSDGQSVPSTLLTLRDSLLTVKGEISNARINAVCCKRPSVINKSPVNTYENPAYKDTAIVIDFGHVVDAGCKDAVVLSSADGNGTDFVTLNKNEYFSSSLNTERTKLTLTPIKMIPFENSNIKTIRVTVPKEKVFYTVNNNKINMNSEDYYWDYVIQNSTSTQTNILYNLNNQNIVAKKINYSSSTTQPYNLEETIPLQLNVKDNYSFNGWRITTGLDTYTVQPEGFVKSGTVLVKSGDDVYFTFTIDADNPAKATAYINKIIGNGIDNYGVSIEASELLMPKAETVELPGIDTAVECDTQQEINFIKALDPYTVSLYSSASEPGSVQIVNANTNEHFERYFTVSCVNGYKRIILKPSIDIIEEFKDTGVSVITLKVILDPNVIIDADGLNIGGITEWIYKINSKTNAKTKIRFTLNNADVLINNEPYEAEKSYDIGEVLNIVCIPDNGYSFIGWSLPESVVSAGTVTVLDIDSYATTLSVNKESDTAVTVSPEVYLVPFAETNISYIDSGINCDTPVVITFNKAVKTETLSLYSNASNPGSIRIVSLLNNNAHYESYYTKNISSDGKTLTLTPKENIYSIIGNSETADIAIKLDRNIIEDTEGYPLEGTTDFSYRIKADTNAKTKVRFNFSNCKINNNNITSGIEYEYNIGQQLEIECLPDENYKFISWAMSAEGFTPVSDNGTIQLKNAQGSSENYMSLEESNLNKSNLTVLKSTGKTVTVSANVSLVPKVNESELTPKYNTAGVNCDTPLVIPFNKPIKENTLNLSSSGSVQIVSVNTGLPYDSYYNAELSSDCKTLTLTPKENIHEILGDSLTADFKVVLIANNIKDTENLNLEGNTTFTFRLNSNTSTHTSINFTDGTYNVYVKNGNASDKVNGFTREYNIGQKIEIECIPDSAYKFDSWIISEGASSDYVSITDINSSTTTITIKKSMGSTAVVLKPKVVLIPKVESISVDNQNGQNCDTEVVITFNKEMKGDTLSIDNGNGSIKIVSAVTGTDRTNYFTKTLSIDLKTLTLKPKENIYEIFEESKTTDLKIVLDETIIKDKENNSLGGTTSFNHRIKNVTTAKTKIQFSGTNCDIYVNMVKDNSSVHECNIGQVLNIKCAADSTHQFAGWLISGEGYTASSGTTPLKLYKENSGSSECFVSIENPGSSETKVTVYKSTGDANISVVPVIELTPAFTTSFNSTASVPCDSPIVLTFNKPMNSSTLTLYKENSSNAYKGSIQIVKNKSTVHCEQYFDSPVYNSSAKTLTITPKETIRNLLDEVASFEFNVILDGNYISDSYGYKSNKQEEFTYIVNTNTIAKTKVKFDFNGAIVKVDGQTINSGDVYEYNYGQTYTIECAPSDNYKFENWSITSYDSSYIIFDDVTPNTSVATKTAKLKTLRPAASAVTVKCNNNEIINFEGGTTNYKISGVNKYKKTEVEFNRTINYSGKIYIATSLDDTVGITSDFDVSSETVSDKFILSVKPNSSFYTKLASGNMIDVYVLLDTTATDSTGVPLSSFYNETNDSSYTLAKINNKNYLQIGRARYNNDLETGNPTMVINSITGYDSTKQLSDIPYNEDAIINSNDGDNPIGWLVKKFVSYNKYKLNTGLSACVRNHCNDRINYTITGTDTESGIKELYIKETLIKTKNNEAKSSEPIISGPLNMFDSSFNSENSKRISNESYIFKSDLDGLLKLEFYFTDNDGNISDIKTYYVIKDTYFNFGISVGVKATNPTNYSKMYYETAGSYDTVFKFGNAGNGHTGDFWMASSSDDFGITEYSELKLGYAYNSDKSELPESISEATQVLSGQEFTVSVTDFENNTYVRLFAADAVGNQDYEDVFIPGYGKMLYSEISHVNGLSSNTVKAHSEIQRDMMDEFNITGADLHINYYVCSENVMGTSDTASDYIKYRGEKLGLVEKFWFPGPSTNNYGQGLFYEYNANEKNKALNGYTNPQIYCQYSYEFTNISEADRQYGGTFYLTITGPIGPSINLTPPSGTGLYTAPGFDFTDTSKPIKPGEINSGKVKCSVTLTDRNENYRYYAIDWKGDQHSFGEENILEFEAKEPAVNNVTPLSVNVMYITPDGNIKLGDEKFVFNNSLNIDYFENIDSSSPTNDDIQYFKQSFDGEYFALENFTEKSELIKLSPMDPREYVTVYYWYSCTTGNDTGSQYVNAEIQMERNLDSYPSRKLKVIRNKETQNSSEYIAHIQNSQNSLMIPVVDLEDLDPYVGLYFVIEDEKGNSANHVYYTGKRSTSLSEGYFLSKVLNSKPVLEFNSNKLTIKCAKDEEAEKFSDSFNEERGLDYSVTISYYNTNDKKWYVAAATDYSKNNVPDSKLTSAQITLDGNTVDGYKREYQSINQFNGLTCKDTSVNLTSKFIKVTVRAHPTNTRSYIESFSYPTYFYTGNVTCNLKNLVEGKNGYSVLSDQPVYVHALASFKDRGTNLDEWERHAEKIPGAYGTSPGVTYNPIDYIQDGDYYVVVAYFADNTYLMSDVKRK